MSFTVTTWNVNSLKVRLPQVIGFLERSQSDVLCLQELKTETHCVDTQAFSNTGYNIEVFGQKTYNGVATILKKDFSFVAEDLVHNLPNFSDPQSRLLASTINAGGTQLRIVNGYFPNGETQESPKYQYKIEWLTSLAEWLKSELKKYPNLILLGDFNIAPDDRDVWDPEGWKDSVLCTSEVRELFQKILNLGLADAFRSFEQPEKSYSWWDYRMMAFNRNRGLRIDHILISEALKSKNLGVTIHKDVRKLERPSDHAPVTLTLDL